MRESIREIPKSIARSKAKALVFTKLTVVTDALTPWAIRRSIRASARVTAFEIRVSVAFVIATARATVDSIALAA